MTDRVPTKILANGAIRYGVYDELGTLLRYEYIKPEDEPTQEGTALNKANLLAEATAGLLGGCSTPNEAFRLLSRAALTKIAPVYTPVTALSQLPEGYAIKLNEGGAPVDFYIAKHDYESGLNGAGRTLLVRKDCYDSRQWQSTDVNAYASSEIDAWLNSTYKALLDADVQAAMGTTTFYYTPGNGSNSVTTLSRASFLLSGRELDFLMSNYINREGSVLPTAALLKIAYLNAAAVAQWTRSPYTEEREMAWYLGAAGSNSASVCRTKYGSRPVFTLPETFDVSGYGMYTDGTNIYSEQAYQRRFTDVLGNNFADGLRVATGSYIGTGLYGEDNPTYLELGFSPKFVFIAPETGQNYYGSTSTTIAHTRFLWVEGVTSASLYRYNGDTMIYPKGTETSFQFWQIINGNGGNNGSMNRTGVKYNYFAIGI